MAKITANNDVTVLKIKEFLGLNESQDGDTTLKNGEMTRMRNFRITQDRHLQIRPGTKTLTSLYEALEDEMGEDVPPQADTRIRGTWLGTVGNKDHIIVSYGGYVWDVMIDDPIYGTDVAVLGQCEDAETHFFAFGGKVYLIDGTNYKAWDGTAGTQFATVDGYIPLVQTATTPAGNGTLVENINRLNGKRRVEFSPDGTSVTFYLPEAPITSVDAVTQHGTPMVAVTGATTTVSGGSVTVSNAATCLARLIALGATGAGSYVLTYTDANKWSITIGGRSYTGYTNLSAVFGLTLSGTPAENDTITITVGNSWTANLTNGTVTFSAAPAEGTNTIEIQYTNGSGSRSEVLGMKYSELFNGSTDTRIFLYGDGTNITIYSGIPYATGKPSAEYFPALYEIAVGEQNTPITGLVRHYSRMMAFKTNSAWSIQYGTLELESSQTTAAFYVQPVNRQIGNDAMGQVRLLENNPMSLDAGSIYQWVGSKSYGYVTSSETNAKRVSDRVINTVRSFELKDTKTYNIKGNYEYWAVYGNKAVILNYSSDAWYVYEGLPLKGLIEKDLSVYGFYDNGDVIEISRKYYSDDGEAIDCYAATGAMDFGKDWMLKYSPMFFVAMMPERNARINVTVESNRRGDYPTKTIAYGLSNFWHMDFAHLSFGTNLKPQVKRVKIKVKKATFYRLIYKSNSASSTATIIETDVKLRYEGNVK